MAVEKDARVYIVPGPVQLALEAAGDCQIRVEVEGQQVNFLQILL